MSERTRRIALQIVVVLGAIVPFLLSAVSESLVPRMLRHSRPIDSVDGPSGNQGDDQDVWQEFGNGASPVDRTGIKYWVDYKRALADAKLSKKPIFLFFSGATNTKSRRIETTVLPESAVIARLRQFECAVLFVDFVPKVDRTEEKRVVSQNWKLLEEWLGDVSIPKVVVVHPDFDVTSDPERRMPLAEGWYDQFRDEANAVRFLDQALAKSAKSPPPVR